MPTANQQASPPKKVRDSNLELMRIVVMLAIVCHHFVLNSGVRDLFDMAQHPANTVLLQLCGMFGKAGINAFVILSAYFMCTSRLTFTRYMKVLVPILLYQVLSHVAAVAFGLTSFSWVSIAKGPLSILRNAGANGSFSASFPVFYLMMPALLPIVRRLGGRELGALALCCVLVCTGLGTFFGNGNLFNEVAWFCVLFFVAAWLRLYGGRWTRSQKSCLAALVASIVLVAASIVALDATGHVKSCFYLVSNPSKIGSLAIGLFTFLVFRNAEMKPNAAINWVAAHTFGVLLFHANWVGRTLLMKSGSLFDMPRAFALPPATLFLHLMLATAVTFVLGVVFDAVVAAPVEHVIYAWCGAHEDGVHERLKRLCDGVAARLSHDADSKD